VFFGPSFDEVTSFSTLVMVLEDPISLGMVFQILLCWIGLRYFLLVVARRFFLAISPGCYVFDNGDPYSRSASDIDQVVWFVFPRILVVVLLPMLDDYSNGYARTHSLGTAAKIKIMGESSLVFIGSWFGTHVLFMRLPSEKYKIAS
jgi:hypothetical protein